MKQRFSCSMVLPFCSFTGLDVGKRCKFVTSVKNLDECSIIACTSLHCYSGVDPESVYSLWMPSAAAELRIWYVLYYLVELLLAKVSSESGTLGMLGSNPLLWESFFVSVGSSQSLLAWQSNSPLSFRAVRRCGPYGSFIWPLLVVVRVCEKHSWWRHLSSLNHAGGTKVTSSICHLILKEAILGRGGSKCHDTQLKGLFWPLLNACSALGCLDGKHRALF